jgi:hypothetical protein
MDLFGCSSYSLPKQSYTFDSSILVLVWKSVRIFYKGQSTAVPEKTLFTKTPVLGWWQKKMVPILNLSQIQAA